jgi:hypothetical protein
MLLFAFFVAATQAGSTISSSSLYQNGTTGWSGWNSTSTPLTTGSTTSLLLGTEVSPSVSVNATTKGLPVVRPPKLETKSTATPTAAQNPPNLSQAAPPTTIKSNPITAGVPPTPKATPPLAEPDVENQNPSITANFLETTTVSIFISVQPVSAEAEALTVGPTSAPITAFTLGSQTLNLGAQITYAGETYSLATNGAFIVGSQSLNPGEQIRDSGTTYSRAANGATLVFDGTSTQVLFNTSPSPSVSALILGSQTLNAGQQITYDGETYSLASNGAFIVGTQTLNPGQQITDSGTTYSRASNGASVIVDGTSTEVLVTPSALASASLSESIAGGTNNNGASPTTHKNTGSSIRGEESVWILGSELLISVLCILEL